MEAAFGMILLVVLLAGVVEFGWAYFNYVALQNAAAEGAAYGMIYPNYQTHSSAPPASNDPNNITYRVRSASSFDFIDWSAVDVEIEADFPTPGNALKVTVSYEYEPITPLAPLVLGSDTLTLRATAIQTVISSGS